MFPNLQLADPSPLDERRFGSVKYTYCVLEDNFEIVQKIFSKIIPLNLRYDVMRDVYEIDAASSYFDPVPMGQVIPEYNVIIKTYRRHGKRVETITFKRLS